MYNNHFVLRPEENYLRSLETETLDNVEQHLVQHNSHKYTTVFWRARSVQLSKVHEHTPKCNSINTVQEEQIMPFLKCCFLSTYRS